MRVGLFHIDDMWTPQMEGPVPHERM